MYAEILFSKQAAGCDIRIILYNYNYHPPSESRGFGCPEIFHSEVGSSVLLLT